MRTADECVTLVRSTVPPFRRSAVPPFEAFIRVLSSIFTPRSAVRLLKGKLGALSLSLVLMACGRLESADPSIRSVSPNTLAQGATAEIEVLGDNFFASANVDLSSRRDVNIDAAFGAYVGTARVPGQNVIARGPRQLSFTFPNGLLPGSHSLMIITPEGKTALLERAFTIQAPSAGGTGGVGGAPQLMATGGSGTVIDLSGCTKLDYNASVYAFCDNKADMPQATAKAACEAAGMKLVRIDSDAENTFVGSTADSLGMGYLWLQANDHATEGVWVWQDGTQFWAGDDGGVTVGGLYNNWESGARVGIGQPNDNSPDPGEDCAVMKTDIAGGYSWFDDQCGVPFALVCEKAP